MDTRTQLATQIRFHLEKLGETNAHHPFEQLCLGLTRRRIVSNVMPATGPVAAGGDDGRDGESYWSALAGELPDTSLFAAMATDEQVVLAVTTQRDDVASKIRSDLEKICAPEAAPVDRVIYFTVTAVPVAKRHDLQRYATTSFSVELDVWDAQAIAEELAEHDLFHLAVDYLHIPSSLTPPRPDTEASLPQWYLDERTRWRATPPPRATTGAFVDLRDALRFAARSDEARADLADWLAAAHSMRSELHGDAALRSRVEYEIVLGSALGMDTILPVDPMLREYFQHQSAELPDEGVLVDSITLLRTAEAMQFRGLTKIAYGELTAWLDNLEQTLERMLADGPTLGTRAQLLSAAALLALGPSRPPIEQFRAVRPDVMGSVAATHQAIGEALSEGSPLPSVPADAEVRDLDRGMGYLVELAGLLPKTPLVPIDQVSMMFDITAPLLVKHPDYTTVRQALDTATVDRSGMAAAGERAQSRGVALLRAGRPIDALREIHTAKLDWLHGEAVEGAALMMLLAAEVYNHLRLPLAAKQYALSAASVAKASGDPALAALVARGLMVAATCEYLAGQWLTATRTFRIGIWAQAALAGDPWSLERYPYFEQMLIDQCFALRTARALRPQLLPLLEPVVESTGLDTMVEPMLIGVADTPPLSEAETVESANASGMGRPFSDAGPVRRYAWSALGNLWTVETVNQRDCVLAAERFVAATQVVLAEISEEDLLLIPGPIAVQVAVRAADDQDSTVFVDRLRSQSDAHQVLLTRGQLLDDDRAHSEAVTAAMQAIATQSLLSRAKFTAVMERTFERGLPHMLTCVRAYDELADVHEPSFFDELSAVEDLRLAPEVVCAPQPADDVAEQSPDQPAEGYDLTAARAAIGARYKNFRPPVQFTLSRLAVNSAFMEVVGRLRAKGWKDWHLLTAIAHITANARAVQQGINMTTTIGPADLQRFRDLMFAEERASDPAVPKRLFTDDQMWFHLTIAARATAESWGLEVRLNPLDPEPFLQVLGQRFNYWSDDVPHAALLP